MKIIVSACLLGDNVKYNGENNLSEELKEFLKGHEIIKVCPEVMGGLTIPRNPCEIKNNKVINKLQEDKTQEYQNGALKVLKLAQENNVKVAILKEKSPSCGSKYIYDGTFSHHLIKGEGITTRILQKEGIIVLNEENYKEYKW